VEESHVRLFKERIELQAKKREEASQHFESPLVSSIHGSRLLPYN
jgi:hypothetical protein